MCKKQNYFEIEGGYKLGGAGAELVCQGSKNALTPLIAAAVLVNGEVTIKNCPNIHDSAAMLKIIKYLGGKTEIDSGSGDITLDCRNINLCEVPVEYTEGFRSAIYFLPVLLARFGKSIVGLPGGCRLGFRGIDYHLDCLNKMGGNAEAQDFEENGTIKYGEVHASVKNGTGLRGAFVNLPKQSVGATICAMLAGSVAKGKTEILNAAAEPEVICLAEFLKACGAKINGAGTHTINIQGKHTLKPPDIQFSVIPDRVAAATYLAAVMATGGEVLLRNAPADDLKSVIPYFKKMGASVKIYPDKNYDNPSIHLNMFGKSVSLPRAPAPFKITTWVHPGFPTDIQPIFMALSVLAKGTTIFIENIFENRFALAEELTKTGAKIEVKGSFATVAAKGKQNLTPAKLKSCDLRAGAGALVAALAINGKTQITEIEYIDRGYENIEENLRKLGARIIRG